MVDSELDIRHDTGMQMQQEFRLHVSIEKLWAPFWISAPDESLQSQSFTRLLSYSAWDAIRRSTRPFYMQSQSDAALRLYVGFDPQAHETAKNEASTLARIGQLNSEYFPKLRRSAWHRIQNRSHPLLVLELGAWVSEAMARSVSLASRM